MTFARGCSPPSELVPVDFQIRPFPQIRSRFLEHPEVEPTNNRAERGLRGSVIARKVSHCSKNEDRARIHKVMKNITATLALRGHQVSSIPAGTISGRSMPQSVTR